MTLTNSFDEMVSAMLSCEQSPGFSVYQHGVSVSKFFFDLIGDVQSNQWKLPDWFAVHKQQIIQNIHQTETISKYLLFHDCGKSASKTIDDNGKVHFPNHAEISGDIWESVGGDHVVGRLIRNDMVLHTATAEEITNKLNDWSIQDACTLLLAAFSEIHSNANMFGGINSISFKVKLKQLDRRGKQLCKYYFREK